MEKLTAVDAFKAMPISVLEKTYLTLNLRLASLSQDIQALKTEHTELTGMLRIIDQAVKEKL